MERGKRNGILRIENIEWSCFPTYMPSLYDTGLTADLPAEDAEAMIILAGLMFEKPLNETVCTGIGEPITYGQLIESLLSGGPHGQSYLDLRREVDMREYYANSNNA